MGIGLVDPILKPIADSLNATPSQVLLLFTSYTAVIAAYSFTRFSGAALAPWLAGVLGERINMHAPFWVGAAAVLLGAGVLAATRSHLGGIDDEDKDVLQSAEDDAVAVTLGTDS
jgi:MFS family permease